MSRRNEADMRYAENTVNHDDDKFKLIGLAGKNTKTLLAPRGQARLLEAPRQGEDWLSIDCKVPLTPAAG